MNLFQVCTNYAPGGGGGRNGSTQDLLHTEYIYLRNVEVLHPVIIVNIMDCFFMPPKELWEAYSNCTVCPSVRPASCPVHISYILWGRNSKFGVWMHLGIGGCCVLFSGHCDRDLDLWLSFYSNKNVRPSVPLRVRCISPIFFEVGIPNLMCGCILRWQSVAYHFRVTVTLTLTSDLVFKIIVSGAYLLYYLR